MTGFAPAFTAANYGLEMLLDVCAVGDIAARLEAGECVTARELPFFANLRDVFDAPVSPTEKLTPESLRTYALAAFEDTSDEETVRLPAPDGIDITVVPAGGEYGIRAADPDAESSPYLLIHGNVRLYMKAVHPERV